MIFKSQQAQTLRRIRDFDNVMVTRLVSERTLDILQSSKDFSSRYIIEDGVWIYLNGEEVRLDKSQEIQPTTVVPIQTKASKARISKVTSMLNDVKSKIEAQTDSNDIYDNTEVDFEVDTTNSII